MGYNKGMLTFLGVIIFVFGTIIGSFLNVVALRYKTGRTVGGRSFCFSCNKTLSAVELVPIVSFCASGGKCRSCKSKISWQYPLVEFVTGFIFCVAFLKTVSDPAATFASMIYFWFVFSILIVISIYDFKHKIVPDFAVFVFIICSFIWLILSHNPSYFASTAGIFDLLSGVILFLPFYLLWKFSDGTWMGLGDGKLAMGIGWMLGFVKGVSAIILGFWSAALVAIAIVILDRVFRLPLPRLNGKTEIPFAPFLAFGALLAFIFNPDLFSLNLLMFGA